MDLHPADQIIVTLLLLVGLGIAWIVLRERRQARAAKRLGLGDGGSRGVRTGPVPGYSRVPASMIELSGGGDLAGNGDELPLRPLSLETFHSPERSRASLRVHLQDSVSPARAEELLRAMAVRLQSRIGTAAVAIEGHRVEEPEIARAADVLVVYTPDGRGWDGSTTGCVLLIAPEGEHAPKRLAAAAGARDAEGAGWYAPPL